MSSPFARSGERGFGLQEAKAAEVRREEPAVEIQGLRAGRSRGGSIEGQLEALVVEVEREVEDYFCLSLEEEREKKTRKRRRRRGKKRGDEGGRGEEGGGRRRGGGGWGK